MQDLTDAESARIYEIAKAMEAAQENGRYQYSDFTRDLREVIFISRGRGMAEFLYTSVPPAWAKRAAPMAEAWARQAEVK